MWVPSYLFSMTSENKMFEYSETPSKILNQTTFSIGIYTKYGLWSWIYLFLDK